MYIICYIYILSYVPLHTLPRFVLPPHLFFPVVCAPPPIFWAPVLGRVNIVATGIDSLLVMVGNHEIIDNGVFLHEAAEQMVENLGTEGFISTCQNDVISTLV